MGPVFTMEPDTMVAIDHLEIDGARTAGIDGPYGYGVECPSSSTGAKQLAITDSLIAQNASAGVRAQSCTLILQTSAFIGNGEEGVSTTDGDAAIDRCTASNNAADGFALDGGTFILTNSFSVRNGGDGVKFYTQTSTNRFDFSTVVDNMEYGFNGQTGQGATVSAANNIIARNGMAQTSCGTCTFPGSLVIATDITPLHFVSPDTSPFDYHLAAGSIAIDAAQASSVIDHDFDGDTRPRGAGYDIGADEAQ
jgi:hypothetical protein